jgi:ABC-2 type transport system permease protein
MRKTFEIFRFELVYGLRRFSTFAYFFVLLALCPMFLQVMAEDDVYFNAPYAVTVVVMMGSLLGLLIVAAFAGDAATRDFDERMHPLFYSSPVGKPAYLMGRFLGAFVLSALVFAALPIGVLLATWLPSVESEKLAPFSLSAHLAPYFLFAIPNAFVGTAVLFALATLTRRSIAGYAGAASLFFLSMACGKLLAPRAGWGLAKLLDPMGYSTVWEWWISLSPLQQNGFALVLDRALLMNRLLWIGMGLVFLALTYARFRFAHQAVGAERRSMKRTALEVDDRASTGPIAVPQANRHFNASTRARQLLAITVRSFRDLHANRVWWIVPLAAIFFVLNAPDIATLEMGLPGPLTTAQLLGFLSGDVSVLLTILIALSAGELVWRERDARIHPLADVTPVAGWIPLTGKFLGLALMLATAMLIFLLTGLFVQSNVGTVQFDLPLYLQVLFGLQLPEYLLIAAMAFVIHVMVNQKYVANVLIVLVPLVRTLVSGMGVDDLLLYGNLPDWVYSDISGFGLSAEARLWFTLYFAGWALLVVLLAHLFWMRGEGQGLRQRIAIARTRLTRGAVSVGALALAIIAGAGGFIVYEKYVRNDSPSEAAIEQRSAEYERLYGRYAALPQPVATATKLQVNFYPERGEATVRGSYRLENRSLTDIDAIHVVTSGAAEATTVSFDRAARPTLMDDARDYRIYALDRALKPGASLRMNFDVRIETELFGSYATPPVVGNGSVLIHKPRDGYHWMPLVGYQTFRELDSAALRRKHGLRERPPYPRLGDVAVGNEQKGYEQIELDTIVGTDAAQTGVAPGELRRTWTANGRRYAHYVTDAPISNAFSITSANYAVHRTEWKATSGEKVGIEIFHHPAHTANLERMVRAAKVSLDYNTKQFGAYPYRQLRFVETPSGSIWLGMSAYSGLIAFQEGFSLVRPEEDARRIDFPFAVVAHEMAHQWWGHRLTPAVVEGAPFLAESLSWYSAMLVVEETLGREHLARILDMMRAQYLGPHQPRSAPLLRSVDHLDAYRVGPFAMYALREAVGVEPVNRALRALLAKFPPGRAPYPTTVDFYAELRAATPAGMHGLLKDLFEEITFWDLRAKSLDVTAVAGGACRVMLGIEARKLKGDGTGAERSVPMNDLVEIALYDAAGKTLHRKYHRVRAGVGTIELTITGAPARAVVDPDHELLDRNMDDNAISR